MRWWWGQFVLITHTHKKKTHTGCSQWCLSVAYDRWVCNTYAEHVVHHVWPPYSCVEEVRARGWEV